MVAAWIRLPMTSALPKNSEPGAQRAYLTHLLGLFNNIDYFAPADELVSFLYPPFCSGIQQLTKPTNAEERD
jgi:hypothetical protein